MNTSTAIPFFLARDQPLATDEARAARRVKSNEPHVAPLQALAERISASTDAPDGVPRFDPLDGGIEARVLFLLEAPGPRAVGTGFVSFDNPDQTAANARHACESAGLERCDVVRWNAVPWYIGNERRTKIRAATRLDLQRAEPWLAELLKLLPRLEVVVLMGKKAQQQASAIARIAPHLRIVETSHCSPLALNRSPERRRELIEKLREVAEGLRASESMKALDAAAVKDTLMAATKAGFTDQVVEDDGHTLCKIPGTNELVDIFPDGSWEWQNAKDDGSMEEMSGTSAVWFALFCGPHRQMFFDNLESGGLGLDPDLYDKGT